MSYKSTKIIAAVSLIIFLVSVSTSITGFYLVSKQKGEYLTYGRRLAEVQAQERLESGLADALEKTKSERALLTSQILEDADVIELLSLIETLRKEQGVVLTTSSLNVETIDENFETLEVNLEVKGAYSAVMRMLALLEHFPYQAVVHTVQLERQGGEDSDEWKGVYSLKVTKFKKNET